MPLPQSPAGATSCTSREGSPGTILTRLEEMPTLQEQFSAVTVA